MPPRTMDALAGAAICLVCHAEIPRYVSALRQGATQPDVGALVRESIDAAESGREPTGCSRLCRPL